jgi:hypothetical protein
MPLLNPDGANCRGPPVTAHRANGVCFGVELWV